jgi:signal peptidase I
MSLWLQERRRRRRFSERATTVFEALVIALVIRSFLFQPFNIPSGSMEPTLLIGDYLFASKFSYGFSRYCRSRRRCFRGVFWRGRRSAATSSFFATDGMISSSA